MKFNRAALCLCTGIIIFFVACHTGGNAPPDVTNVDVSLQITRWDEELFQSTSKKDVEAFLERNPLFSKEFLHTDQYPHDSLAVNYLFNFISNPASKVLQQEVQSVYGDMTNLQRQFTEAFRYLRYYYPQAKIPKIYTAITGFAGNDLWVSDSAIVVGLDYYLGESATFRPLEFPNYILKRYRPQYIVPSAVLLLSGAYNNTNFEDETMLAEMIYFGKAYYFASQILPHAPDSLLIGYSGEELNNIYNNQDLIWAHIIDNKLLYETSHFVKKKYMEERPRTLEIGDKCPGRIGEWVGWEIVKKYMGAKHPGGLPELMANKEAQDLFMQSKYRPQPL